MPAVLNAANEVAVEGFLENRIPFSHIPIVLEEVMSKHSVKQNPSLQDIIEADAWGRQEGSNFLQK